MGLKENIKKRRLELGMTLETLANMVDTTRQTIQRYESGVISNIPHEKIVKLASSLKTTPAALMGWDNKNKAKYQKADLSVFDLIGKTVMVKELDTFMSPMEVNGIALIKGEYYAIELNNDMEIEQTVSVRNIIIE